MPVSTAIYYVESYHAATACKSNRTPVTATVYAIPALPTVTPVTNCGPGSFNLSANNTTSCRWYETETDETPVSEEATYTTGTVNASRSYFVSNVNANTGCESERTELSITLYPVYEPRDIFVETCQSNQHYHYINGQIDTNFNVAAPQTSVYTFNLKTQYNCDSTIVLHLTVNPAKDTNLYVTTCQSDALYPYQNGQIDTNLNVSMAQPQTITYHFSTVEDCDSTVTVHVTVNPTYAPVINRTICEGSSIFFGGEYRTTAGTYVDSLQSINGCDSMVTLNLQVSEQELVIFTQHVCYGDSYNQNGFNIQNATETHTYTNTGTSVSQCDSITELHLIVHDLNTTVLHDTLCLGENFSKQGFNVTPATAGDTVITRMVKTPYNCDSTIVLNLRVNPVYYLSAAVTTCQSEMPYHYDAENEDLDVHTPGTRTILYHHETTAGCDSNITLTLTVTPTYHTTIPLSVCQSETPYPYKNGAIDTTFDISTPRQETIVYNFETMNQCDSIITLNLTVNPSYSKDTTVSVCENDLPYIWDNEAGFTYHTGGDKTITYPLPTGCDSIIHLHLIVHESFEKDTTIQVCEGALPYVFGNNNVFPSQGNYPAELVSSFGCDSIYHVNLIVTPTITHTVTQNICDNSLPFHYGDSVFNQAGQYAVVTSRADGCNEVTYLTLNVYPTYNHTATLAICESQLPYRVGDTTFTEAGTKTVHFSTSHSCDSAVTVTLVVNPEYDFHFDGEVCQGERYTGHGFDTLVAQAGNHTLTRTYVLPTTCDSTVTVNLTVKPSFNTSRSVTLCANSAQLPYTFGDTVLTTSGVYTYNFHTTAGCDSIETLTFTVKSVYDTTITASICRGESYNGNGFNITPDSVGTRTYTRNLTSSLDCDSTVNLVLTVNPDYFIPENETVHSVNLPYFWHGREFNESTTAYDSLTTVAGCDSVCFLTLTVTDYNVVKDNPVVLCQGESQTWRGRELSETGTYIDTVVAENTIYMVDVTVNPSYHLYDTLEVCESDLQQPYIWHGIRFTRDSTMEVTYQTATYCDSIYTLTFIVHPTYNIYADTTVCGDEIPFIWHGKTVSGPGNYTDSLNTAFGCDSIHTLAVNVTYVTAQQDSMTVCGEDATYAWHNTILSETGIYRDTLRNANGCDSIVYTMNFVKGMPFFHMDSVVLSGTQVYEWRGRQITVAGTYFDSLQTVVGCDSVYGLVATEHQYQYIQSNPISLCPGDSALWLDKVIYEDGTYQDTVVNGGVHYVYTVVVTLNQSFYFADTVTTCQSELPFYWHGVSRTQAGVYYDSKQTVNGCDSIYTLTLLVDSSYAYMETATICSNEAPYIWHGDSLFESGIFYDSLQTVAGCDSVYMLTLTVNPAIRQNDTAETCQGTPYVWRGRSLQTSGFYADSVANTFGCEDIYTLFLTVTPKNFDTVRATICMGDTYNENGFNVTPAYAGTIYDQLVLTNQYGCDSIVSLVLTVNNSYLFETVAATCDGTPYEWRGGEYVVEGTYYDRYATAAGCDSVFVLHLTVNPTYEVYVTDSIHFHETYDNYGITVTPSDTGIFTYTINGFTQSGCDSIIYLTLVVQGNIGVNDYVAPQLRIYPNPAQTFVNIEGEGMARVSLYDMHGRLLQAQDAETPERTRLNFTTPAAGYYVLRVQLQNGAIITRKIMVKRF